MCKRPNYIYESKFFFSQILLCALILGAFVFIYLYFERLLFLIFEFETKWDGRKKFAARRNLPKKKNIKGKLCSMSFSKIFKGKLNLVLGLSSEAGVLQLKTAFIDEVLCLLHENWMVWAHVWPNKWPHQNNFISPRKIMRINLRLKNYSASQMPNGCILPLTFT